MVLDLISDYASFAILPNRHTGLRSLSSHCFATNKRPANPLTSVSSAAVVSYAFRIFLSKHSRRLFQAQQRAIEDEIDNVARRFEQPQPVREPKFIGKRDRIVGRRNYLTPQGSNSRSTNCS